MTQLVRVKLVEFDEALRGFQVRRSGRKTQRVMKWAMTEVNDYGAGSHMFSVYKPSFFCRFKAATADNEAVLLDLALPRLVGSIPTVAELEEYGFDIDDEDEIPNGVFAETGDVITVNFVVPQLALRVILNDQPGDDEEDEAILQLGRLVRDLGT